MKKASSVLLSTLLISTSLIGTAGASGKASKSDFHTGVVMPVPVVGSLIFRSIKGNPEADQALTSIFKRIFKVFEELKQKDLLFQEIGIYKEMCYLARIMNKDYIKVKFSEVNGTATCYFNYDRACQGEKNEILKFDDNIVGRIEYIIRKMICKTYLSPRNNFITRAITGALEGKENYLNPRSLESKDEFLSRNTRKSILSLVETLEPLVKELENINNSSTGAEVTPKLRAESKFISYDILLERKLCGGYTDNPIDKSPMSENIETMYRALEENNLLSKKLENMYENAYKELYDFAERVKEVTKKAIINRMDIDGSTARKWENNKQHILEVTFKNLYNALKEQYIKNCDILEK